MKVSWLAGSVVLLFAAAASAQVPATPPATPPAPEAKPAPDPRPVTATPDKDVEQGIVHLNTVRIRLGLPVVDYDPVSSAPCEKHGQYLKKHGRKYAHFEDPKHRDYDAKADRAAHDSVIAFGLATCADGCKSLLNTFLHRVPLLQPKLRSVGLARVGGTVLYEYRTGLARPEGEFEWKEPIIVPADGWTGMPVSWYGESPEFYKFNPLETGVPITVTFPPTAKVTDVTFKLVAAGSVERKVHLWTPESPAHEMWKDNMNTVCAIPFSRMEWATDYTCTLDCKVNGAPKSWTWTFKTVEAPPEPKGR